LAGTNRGDSTHFESTGWGLHILYLPLVNTKKNKKIKIKFFLSHANAKLKIKKNKKNFEINY